jgi:hypothetical protein
MKSLTAVSAVTKTLAAIASKYNVFSTQSSKDPLKRLAEKDSSVPVQQKVSSEAQLSRNNSSATETVTATATVKNQKISQWFLYYKSVQEMIVARAREIPNKIKCQTSAHKLFVTLPRQHVTVLTFFLSFFLSF